MGSGPVSGATYASFPVGPLRQGRRGADPGEQQPFHTRFANLWMSEEFGNTLVSHAALVINRNVNSVLGVTGSAKQFAAAVRWGGTMKSGAF